MFPRGAKVVANPHVSWKSYEIGLVEMGCPAKRRMIAQMLGTCAGKESSEYELSEGRVLHW